MRKIEKNREKGITLIALVVTIVILLILAGISISMLTGENGIITNAQNAKKEHQIGEEQERLEMIRTEKYFKYGGKLTLEKFIEELQNDGTIKSKYSDDTYITDKGFIATVKKNENGDIEIIVEGKSDSVNIRIDTLILTPTSSSIKVDVITKWGENATYKYYIKKIEDIDYPKDPEYEGSKSTYTIVNLDKQKEYKVKVEVTNKNGEAEKEESTTTIDLILQQGVISFGDLTWDETTHKASVKITNAKADQYGMKYSITTIGGDVVQDYTEVANNTVISELELNQVIRATLWDGINFGTGTATLTIDDTTVPNEASISLSSTETVQDTSITATVSLSDSQSGVDLSKCRWAFNTDSSKTIAESSYSSSNTISTQTNAQITLNSSTVGTYYLHILTVDKAGNKTQTVSTPVTVKAKEITGTGEWNGTVNEPLTTTEMRAITYDANGNPQTVTDKSEWFNYDTTNRKWANTQSSDGSYWVWIPRYEYKITYTNSSDYSQGGTIDINFIPKSKTTATTGYKIHPAFRDGSSKGLNNNHKNGEWDNELSGIWVAKYEMSGESSTDGGITWTANSPNNTEITATKKTTQRAVSKPGVMPWNYIQWGNCYANAQIYATNLELTGIDSHLMKNSEWGAVAYLAHSKYGRDGERVKINYASSGTDVRTGGSLGATATTNIDQSSTGNAYGIYDLSGGLWEYVAGYVANYNFNGKLSTYGSSSSGTLYVNTTENATPYKTTGYNTKYLTAYPYDSKNDNQTNNYTAYKNASNSTYGYGDAILETSSESGLTSWYNEYSFIASYSKSFFIRGGYYQLAGMFGVCRRRWKQPRNRRLPYSVSE